jgi:hypothetical protein
MPSRISPPGTSTTLTLPGELPLSGDLILEPGAGFFGSIDRASHKITLAAQLAGPAETLCLFAPTPSAALAIGQFTNPRPSGSAVVVLLDANMLVPPTGATGANNLSVRVRGATSGSGTIPLLGAFQSLDLATPTAVAGTTAAGTSTSSATIAGGPDTHRGYARGFRVGSTKTLQSLTFRVNDDSAGSTINAATGPFIRNGVPKRFELLGPDMKPLPGTVLLTSRAMADGEYVTVPFSQSVTLSPGKTYYAAMSRTDVAPMGWGNSPSIPWGVSPCVVAGPTNLLADTSNGADATKASGWSYLRMSSNVPQGKTWADLGYVDDAGARLSSLAVTDSAAIVPDGADATTRTGLGGTGAANDPTFYFSANGSTGGFVAVGPLLVDLVQVGTGPTTPGTGLNVRVSLSNG